MIRNITAHDWAPDNSLYFDNRLFMFVFQLMRHGDRAPVQRYPSIPSNLVWPYGLGELTTVRTVTGLTINSDTRARHVFNFFS